MGKFQAETRTRDVFWPFVIFKIQQGGYQTLLGPKKRISNVYFNPKKAKDQSNLEPMKRYVSVYVTIFIEWKKRMVGIKSNYSKIEKLRWSKVFYYYHFAPTFI